MSEVEGPAGATVIDGAHLFVMPGLFDAHVHFVDPPLYGMLMVANGVVFVRDMGMPTAAAVEVRERLNSGALVGPEMVVTGSILDGFPLIIPELSLGLITPTDARKAVRAQAASGVDMIKVYSRLASAVFGAIVEEAHSLGLKVVGHVPDSVSIEEAASIGLDSSEHDLGFDKLVGRLLGEYVRPYYAGMGIDAEYFQRQDEVDADKLAEVLEQLRVTGLNVCPTIVALKQAISRACFLSGTFDNTDFVSSAMLAAWDVMWRVSENGPATFWEPWSRFVVRLHDADIPLMVGTDASVPGIMPGSSVHDEMEIWQEAGIPAPDILRSATLVPAQFMGVADRLGCIAPGATASLVLLRANPLADVTAVREIEGVFLRGEYYDREALDGLLREARSLAAH
jgi:imidazolonepropionase-like amidohydrolase